MTVALSKRVADAGGRLDVIDVLPTQLGNLQRKLPADAPVALHLMDSASLAIPDGSYDRALIFFLLHEQPEAWRIRTLAEAFRVVKPGGRIVIVDYACPAAWNPMKRLFGPILKRLEPFALDLWHKQVSNWMPEPWANQPSARRTFFGGLYQEVVIQT
jgi:ubiquinone/menaquinone biosynthesis C-methylase UbiE